jgi:hypothetical protein
MTEISCQLFFFALITIKSEKHKQLAMVLSAYLTQNLILSSLYNCQAQVVVETKETSMSSFLC